MNKLAVEMTKSLVHERLQATSTSNDSVISEPFFDVAEKIVDIVLSAIILCEAGLNTRYGTIINAVMEVMPSRSRPMMKRLAVNS